MVQPSEPEYELRLLNEADSCTGFKLGDAGLTLMFVDLHRLKRIA